MREVILAMQRSIVERMSAQKREVFVKWKMETVKRDSGTERFAKIGEILEKAIRKSKRMGFIKIKDYYRVGKLEDKFKAATGILIHSNKFQAARIR